MRRPGITARLFLTLLGLTLVVVVTMVLTAQYTFRNDFLEYVQERERERITSLSQTLSEHYQATGSWTALQDPERWRWLLSAATWGRGEGGRAHGPGDRRTGGADAGGRDRDGARHRSHRSPRIGPLRPTLLDADGERVAGATGPIASMERVPVEAAGATVGWLAYRPAERITDRLALRFQDEQIEAAWITAVGVGVLAAVVSLVLAHGFVAPVRRLARGTQELTAGRFEARVHEPRRDELGQLAHDFNRLAETLERNERLRRDFMADMSHELRTPLSVLRAELEAFEDGVRPLTRDALAGLQGSVATLSQLVDDLYELSLADAGALVYRMESLDLGALVAATAEPWRARFEAADMALVLDVPEAPLRVHGDARRLGQLLANLLRNSLSYTDIGGRVRIALVAEQEMAVLRVEDSAPGVPPEAMERLFERLYRVEGSRSRASGGAGLGLAICQRIAEAHDGQLDAYAAPLGGVGIRLILPREPEV